MHVVNDGLNSKVIYWCLTVAQSRAHVVSLIPQNKFIANLRENVNLLLYLLAVWLSYIHMLKWPCIYVTPPNEE